MTLTTPACPRGARPALLAAALAAFSLAATPATAQYVGIPWGGAYVGYPGAVGYPAYFGPSGFGVGYGGWGLAGTAYGFGYPGYGYGYPAFGYAGGYGGYGGLYGMGMSPADQAMVKFQSYALNEARYNLMNAQAATAYQAANLMQQQALQTMVENYTGAKYPTQAPTRGSDYGSGGGGAGRPVVGDIPFNELVARDGEVLWPLGAPTEGDLADKKQAADEAIARVVRDLADDGNVSVRSVVAARRALSEYAVPAARHFRDQGGDEYDAWVNWVTSLDRGLRDLVAPGTRGEGRTGRRRAAPAAGFNINTRPDAAPRNAGDVLKDQVRDESPAAPERTDRKPDDPRDEAPPAPDSPDDAGPRGEP